MDKKDVTINWHCGYYVGEAHWHCGADWYYEPDECDTDFDTHDTLENLVETALDGANLHEECPTCGADNNTADDEPILVLWDGTELTWKQFKEYALKYHRTMDFA